MVSLLVREDDGCGAQPDDAQCASRRMQSLERLQILLQGILAGEARMWLRGAVAELALPAGSYATAFENLLSNAAASCRSVDAEGVTEEPVVRQVVRLVCESRARAVAGLLGCDPSLLKRFFDGSDERIKRWFGSFACGEQGEHQLGSRALARYAFVHRESCWEELEWQGHHAQAPATVAAKPHYFRELDVVGTVENLLARVPGFWSSEELWDSLRDGVFISLDVEFFVKELLWRMFNDNCSQTWQLVRDFIAEESFSLLSRRILHLVDDAELLMFVNDLAAAGMERGEVKSGEGLNERKVKTWLEFAVSRGVKWKVLDDLLLGSACASNARQLFRLLQDEEHLEQAALVCQVIGDMKQASAGGMQGHWALRRELVKMPDAVACKWLAVEAWLLYSELREQEESALGNLLVEISTGFKRQGLENRGQSRDDKRQKRKPLRSGFSKRMRLGDRSEVDDSSCDARAVTPNSICWRLSVDDYSMVWTKDDIADYLRSYSLDLWLRHTVEMISCRHFRV